MVARCRPKAETVRMAAAEPADGGELRRELRASEARISSRSASSSAVPR